ncbi:MAG: SCO family protein [Marmoricola sp.]
MSHPERTQVRTRRRRRRVLATVVVGATFAALAACGSSAGSVPNISGGSELDAVLPARIANMALTNQDGKTVRLADFKGKTIVVQDAMTLCQEQCPIDTATFVGLARQYEKTGSNPSDTVFLSITVDPQRDDAAQLAAYRALYAPGKGALPQWQMLTGAPADIAALWKYFHVYTERVHSHDVVRNWRTGALLTYDVQHSDEVFFIDKNLQQRYLLEGMPSLGGVIPTKIKGFMTEEGMQNMKMSNWTVANGLTVLDWVRGL